MVSNSKFNQKLINLIDSHIPQKSKQIDLLTESLFLGKEAAYRRLRGEVQISFHEACIIAEILGISLDNLINVVTTDHDVLYKMITPPAHIDSVNDINAFYHDLVYNEHLNAFKKYAKEPNLNLMTATNTIPHALLFTFPYLSRLRAFKWIYQLHIGPMPFRFSDIKADENMEAKLRDLSVELRNNAELTFIFSRYMFLSFIQQIQHFQKLQFLSDEDIAIIKEELTKLISLIEEDAMRGRNNRGDRIWIYLSNVDFESNYTYLHFKDFEESFMHIYQIHSISSTDPVACRTAKVWIESLKKYSTLISISGEVERNTFFEAQKKYIKERLLPTDHS